MSKKLTRCLDDFHETINNSSTHLKENQPYDVYNLSKTHNTPINCMLKPFIPIDKTYKKAVSSHTGEHYKFFLDLDKFSWIGEFYLVIKIPPLESEIPFRYARNFHEKIIDRVQISVKDTVLDSYNFYFEQINKAFCFFTDSNVATKDIDKDLYEHRTSHKQITIVKDILFDFRNTNRRLLSSLVSKHQICVNVVLSDINAISNVDVVADIQCDLFFVSYKTIESVYNAFQMDNPYFKVKQKQASYTQLQYREGRINLCENEDNCAIERLFVGVFDISKFTDMDGWHQPTKCIDKMNIFVGESEIYFPFDDTYLFPQKDGWIDLNFNEYTDYVGGFIVCKKDLDLAYTIAESEWEENKFVLIIYSILVKPFILN